jgi:hypothetical protein
LRKVINAPGDGVAMRMGSPMIRTLAGGDLAARRDEIVAVIIAPRSGAEDGVYLDELIARVGNLRMPGDGFADDVEGGMRFFAERLRDPWDS